MTKRSKKIIILHHCLLNQNARARGTSKVKNLSRWAADKNLEVIQLPCPEIELLGADRPPHTKEFYNQPKFRNICKRIAKETINSIKSYKKKKYKIIGIVGINRSPSCSVTKEKGILVEEISKALQSAKLKIPYLDYSQV